jgi:hypothetical protein
MRARALLEDALRAVPAETPQPRVRAVGSPA